MVFTSSMGTSICARLYWLFGGISTVKGARKSVVRTYCSFSGLRIGLRRGAAGHTAAAGPPRRRRGLEFPQLFDRPHPAPDNPAARARRMGGGFLPEPLRRARRLGGHVEHVAFDVEFPAVIQAAQAALLGASEGEGGAAMQAVLAQDAKPILGIPEDHQVLAQQPRADRLAVGFGHLLRHADRQAVGGHDAPHGGIAPPAAPDLIFP